MVLTLYLLTVASGGAGCCYRPRASVANSQRVLVSLGFIVAYASSYLIVIVRLTLQVLRHWHYLIMWECPQKRCTVPYPLVTPLWLW